MNKKYKILIVDDTPDWIKNHCHLLNLFFDENLFEVHTSASAREAFTLVQSVDYSFDLVISDLEMELMLSVEPAGQWLVRNLQALEECKNTKFVIISARYDIQKIAEKLKVDYISKSTLLNNPISFKYKIEELLRF